MKKLPLKIHNDRKHAFSWVCSFLPEDYQDFDYMELSSTSFFMNKEPSNGVNVFNPKEYTALFCAMRDEPQEFIKKIKSTRKTKNVFEKLKAKEEYKDYFDQAVTEFLVSRMSRGENGKHFAEKNQDYWDKTFDLIKLASSKIEGAFLMNKDKSIIDIINAFSDENIIMYFSLPDVEDFEDVPGTLTTDQHDKISKRLNKFVGKVIVHGNYSTFFNRMYGEWTTKRKKFKSSEKMDYLWMNF